jgi:hypothetical protein
MDAHSEWVLRESSSLKGWLRWSSRSRWRAELRMSLEGSEDEVELGRVLELGGLEKGGAG